MEILGTVDFVEAVRLLQEPGPEGSRVLGARARDVGALADEVGRPARRRDGGPEGRQRAREGRVGDGGREDAAAVPNGAVAEIAALLQDGREEVQVAACEALGVTASKEAVPGLISLTKSPKERVGVAAADALMLIKDPSAAPALIAMLNGGTWRTQVAAINGLAVLRVKDSVWPLIAYLKDSEGRPREDARAALEGITTMNFGINGARWEEWWNGVKDTSWSVPPLPKRRRASRWSRRATGTEGSSAATTTSRS